MPKVWKSSKVTVPIAPELTEEEKKQNACKYCLPNFDIEHVREYQLTWVQVRKKYPRFNGTCKTCGYHGTKYASNAHCVFGGY